MSDSKFDVTVIGAGISGLLSALALSKEGKRVLVLEKSGSIGGNCMTYEVEDTGFFVDTGVHAITGLNNGPLVQLMNKYFNSAPRFVPHGEYYVRYPGGFMPFPNTIKGLMNFKALSRLDRARFAKIVIETIAHLSVVEKSDISAYEIVRGKGLSEAGMRLVDSLAYFSSGISMKETPAWRILSAGGLLNDGERKVKDKIADFFRLAINKSYTEQGYPAGGIQTITNCALHSLPKSVQIKTGEEAAEIKEEKNFLSVAAGNNTYKAGAVIYSGEAKKLSGIAAMPKEWAESAKKLKQSRAMTIWLGLKKPIDAMSYRGSEVWFSEGVPYWAMPTSSYDPHLAPRGKQLAGFSSFIHPDEDPSRHEKALLRTIYSAIPEIEENVEMKHVQVIVPEKAAVSVGVKFPSPITPIKNLYLVGTDADMRSMGVTRASYSVIEVLKMMNLW